MTIKQRGTMTPLPLYFVELNPEVNNKELFYVKFTKITIEEPYAQMEMMPV